jgi:hypothetical protein
MIVFGLLKSHTLLSQGSAPHYLSLREERTRLAVRGRLKALLPADAQGAIVLPARSWAFRAIVPLE